MDLRIPAPSNFRLDIFWWIEMKHGALGPVSACMLAEWTGLEPATPGVTGRYSNQLNYHSKWLPHRCASAIKLGVP